MLLESYLSKEGNTPVKSSTLRNIEYSLVGNPYKRAVICILDRTNLVDAHEDVLLCLEDFLWIKLAQIPVESETTFNDRSIVQLSIARLQLWILRDLGEDYFKAYEQPFRYTRILLLCGAFESACEFLFKLATTKVHAVHLAIYFHEKLLLSLTSSNDECMIMIAGSLQQNKADTSLNLPKLIESYVREKCLHDQRRHWLMINYAHVLNSIEHLEADDEFRRLLIDLTGHLDDVHVIYGQWLIEQEDDDSRKRLRFQSALLHRLLAQSDPDEINDVLIGLATTIEEHHQANILIAAMLFELAEEYQRCLNVLCNNITQIILDRLLIPSSTATPSPFVYQLAQRLQILQRKDLVEQQQTFFLLLDIYAFVDYYLRSGQHSRAFLVLRQLRLFPFGKDPDEDEQARQLFASNRHVSSPMVRCRIFFSF
jgi:hypothetical protein